MIVECWILSPEVNGSSPTTDQPQHLQSNETYPLAVNNKRKEPPTENKISISKTTYDLWKNLCYMVFQPQQEYLHTHRDI